MRMAVTTGAHFFFPVREPRCQKNISIFLLYFFLVFSASSTDA